MGYYVAITDSTARIPQANLKRAYDKMCALNVTHDSKKLGGSWAGGSQTSRHFSWMDENYPETCGDARAILEQLGFDCDYNDAGDLLIMGYDSKTGQEDLFLKAIEMDAVGMIDWRGEEGETWTTRFLADTVIEAPKPLSLLGY